MKNGATVKWSATMKIRTEFIYPPIPIRTMDWCAIDGDSYDGPGCPVGYGETEQEAINDLLEQIEERKEWREYKNGE